MNVDALRGVPVPKAWKDLLKPEYAGLVGYLDPTSAAVGYAAATAANLALGGTLPQLGAGHQVLQGLKKNRPIVPLQTSYARVLSGEIPIMFDYDFNTLRAKYKDKCNCVFVIPQEGTHRASLRDGPGEGRPAPREREEGARLPDVGQGPGDLGQRLPEADPGRPP